MELAQITVSLKLGTQLVMALLLQVLRLVISSFRGGSTYAVVFIEVDARVLCTVFPRGNDTTTLLRGTDLVVEHINFEESLGRVHVRVKGQLAGCLLQVLDAFLTFP